MCIKYELSLLLMNNLCWNCFKHDIESVSHVFFSAFIMPLLKLNSWLWMYLCIFIIINYDDERPRKVLICKSMNECNINNKIHSSRFFKVNQFEILTIFFPLKFIRKI